MSYDARELDATLEEAINYLEQALEELIVADNYEGCQYEIDAVRDTIKELNNKRENIAEACAKAEAEDQKALEDEYNRMRM